MGVSVSVQRVSLDEAWGTMGKLVWNSASALTFEADGIKRFGGKPL